MNHEEKAFTQVLNILRRLRSEDGCPWDKAQSIESVQGHLVEELWELVDTIERRDFPHMREELGDVLLNLLHLGEIAQRDSENVFSWQVCLDELSEKLIRRHPHVFQRESQGESLANTQPETASEVIELWQSIKEQEKRGAPKLSPASALDGLDPKSNALLYSVNLQKKMAKMYFDWPNAEGIFAKIDEEVNEFALASKLPESPENKKKLEMELGDILFSVVNLARYYKINPELALMRSAQKCRTRFEQVLQKLSEQGLTPSPENLDKMEDLWGQSKAKEED